MKCIFINWCWSFSSGQMCRHDQNGGSITRNVTTVCKVQICNVWFFSLINVELYYILHTYQPPLELLKVESNSLEKNGENREHFKLTITINWFIVESGVKHHNSNPPAKIEMQKMKNHKSHPSSNGRTRRLKVIFIYVNIYINKQYYLYNYINADVWHRD